MARPPGVPTGPVVPLPPGLRVASIAARLGAWVVDSLILGVVFVIVVLAAAAAGAIGVNAEAERQLELAPATLPTVAPYVANLPSLAAFAVFFVLVSVGFATVLVARFRGLPGQLMFSLQVGDVETGRNLGLRRAAVRAVVSVGIPSAGAAGFLFSIVALESSVPWSEVVNPQPGGAAEIWLASWAAPILVAMLALFVWPVVLLISTAASRTHRGLHDVAGRSQVVGRVRATFGYGHPVEQMPGYPYGAWPAGVLPPPGAAPGFDHSAAAATGGVDAPSTPAGPGSSPPTEAAPAPDGPPALERAPLWTGSRGADDTPVRLRGATIGRRTGAYLVDTVVVYMVFALIQTILLMTVLKSAAPADSTQVAFDERTSILIGLLGGVLQVVYFVPGWAIWRGTVAQRLMHLDVGDASTGKKLGWMDAFLRWAVMQGPIALIAIVPQVARAPMVFVATAWVFYLHYSTQTNRNWQGLHDRFVNSRVAQEV
jgi:hypothetical protein